MAVCLTIFGKHKIPNTLKPVAIARLGILCSYFSTTACIQIRVTICRALQIKVHPEAYSNISMGFGHQIVSLIMNMKMDKAFLLLLLPISAFAGEIMVG